MINQSIPKINPFYELFTHRFFADLFNYNSIDSNVNTVDMDEIIWWAPVWTELATGFWFSISICLRLRSWFNWKFNRRWFGSLVACSSVSDWDYQRGVSFLMQSTLDIQFDSSGSFQFNFSQSADFYTDFLPISSVN